MAKIVNFESREKMIKGMLINCDAVISTLGPKGRSVFIDNNVTPKFTKDGATISRSIELIDPIENIGNKVTKNACDQTLDDAGDGTTTTACILKFGTLISIERPENEMVIKASLLEAKEKVLEIIKSKAKPVKKGDVYKVALISSESEVLAKEIDVIFNKLGKDAKVTIEDSYDLPTHHEIIDGYEAHVGYMNPDFGNEKGKCILENAPVFVSEKKIATLQDIAPIFGYFAAKGITNPVIVCEDIDNSILGLLVNNKKQKLFNGVVIKAVGDLLKDIEAVVGATRVSDETGVNFQMMAKTITDHKTNTTVVDPNFTNKYLGRVKKITCDASTTVFIPYETKSATARANFLQNYANTEQNMYVKQKLEDRVSKLKGKVAILKIGGSDFLREDLKDKADDAIRTVKAALSDGIVEGGGMCLWRIAQEMKPKTIGEEIMKKVLTTPFKQILKNAGLEYGEILLGLKDGQGYDARNNCYTDMIKSGIIDAAKVEWAAVKNGIDNAAQFITSEVTITDHVEKK